MRSIRFMRVTKTVDLHLSQGVHDVILFVIESFLKLLNLSCRSEELQRLRLKSTEMHLKHQMKIKRSAFHVLLITARRSEISTVHPRSNVRDLIIKI